MIDKFKKYETIGCCGIDCGLCPRFHTNGDSACPGSWGLNFKVKHPTCGFLTCCVIKNGFETCSDCSEFLCKRFDAEKNGCDSFVTHRKVFENLDFINKNGIDEFIDYQKERINILINFLTNYDDGRSKSFFCLSCALLPLDKLLESQSFIREFDNVIEVKEKNKLLKNNLIKMADTLKINLKLKRSNQ